MRKYTNYIERRAARAEQMRQARARQAVREKQERQENARICPLWKAVAMIQAAIDAGYSYAEAKDATLDVLADRGLKLRVNSL